MPILWFVKDGPTEGATTGEGVKLSFLQLAEIFEDYRVRYISEEPKPINNNSSRYPNRVVVYIAKGEQAHGKFPRVGYYLFQDLSSQKAEEMLNKAGIT